ncbi:hypothetical protein VTK56DRAFT_3645 [Thermocarpiscus australiensis]
MALTSLLSSYTNIHLHQPDRRAASVAGIRAGKPVDPPATSWKVVEGVIIRLYLQQMIASCHRQVPPITTVHFSRRKRRGSDLSGLGTSWRAAMSTPNLLSLPGSFHFINSLRPFNMESISGHALLPLLIFASADTIDLLPLAIVVRVCIAVRAGCAPACAAPSGLDAASEM